MDILMQHWCKHSNWPIMFKACCIRPRPNLPIFLNPDVKACTMRLKYAPCGLFKDTII
jgi:hypothetical protein